MKRGIVMELRDGKAVLMDGSGDIASVSAHSHWRLGDTVEFPKKQSHMTRWAALAAALILMLGVGVFGKVYVTPYSLVSLDVNPSLELRLNRFDRVIDLRAMNDEGETLANLTQVKNQPLEAALTGLLEEEYLADYLNGDAYVTLTVQGGDPARAQALLGLMNGCADRALSGRAARVESVAVDTATVSAAHGCGVTAGKYLALLELQAADPAIDITAYTHCGIGEIKEETVRCYGHMAENRGHGNGNGSGHRHGRGHG